MACLEPGCAARESAFASLEPPARLIEGSGTPESAWRADPAVAGAALVALDDLIGPQSRLVVIAPHPDDEVLACGGLLALHAQRGGKVLVLAVTDGEASYPESNTWTPASLAVVRRLESADGLGLLAGAASAVLRLGLPDGQVAGLQGQLVSRMRALLSPDDVVVVTWHLDGHPDHDAAGEAARTACAQSGCRLLEAPVWMWHWSHPGDIRIPWQRLRRLPLPAPVLSVKQAALAAHKSQWQPGGFGDKGDAPVLGRNIVERAARSAEYFFV